MGKILSVLLALVMTITGAGCTKSSPMDEFIGKWQVEKVKIATDEREVTENIVFEFINEQDVIVYQNDEELERGIVTFSDDNKMTITQSEYSTEYEYSINDNILEIWIYVTDALYDNEKSIKILRRIEE